MVAPDLPMEISLSQLILCTLGFLCLQGARPDELDEVDEIPERCRRRVAGSVIEGRGSSTDLWPSSMGHPGNYGNSKHEGPNNLTKAFSWSWADPVLGRFKAPGMGGTVIDDEKNIYLAANFAMIKFSPDGQILWGNRPPPNCPDYHDPRLNEGSFFMNSPSLWGSAVYAFAEQGNVIAFDRATGAEIWSTAILGEKAVFKKFSLGFLNNGFVHVSDGVVVVDGVRKVFGLDAVNGTLLWKFTPDCPMWNFKADFPGDGTFVFQNWEGEAYRVRLHDGVLIWKAGGQHGTWTDGSIALGPNNIVYAVNTKWPHAPERQPKTCDVATFLTGEGGELSAYVLETGERLWTYEFQRPPNNTPAIGRLSPGADYSVIMPVGQQDRQGEQYWVYALDAKTGQLQWIFDGPVQTGRRQAMQDLSPEQQAHINPSCIPNPWSAPTIDATGTVYIANQEGPIFALKDVNGDGKVNGSAEVDSYNTDRGFCGSEAPSIVPGLMAIASCDTMYVFRHP